MDGELEDIRERLAQLPKRGTKRQYTADVKPRVIEYVVRTIDDGGTEAAACAAVGIHQATVTEWRKGPRQRSKSKRRRNCVRPVELAAAQSESGLALVLPGGARVEGLNLEQVVEVAKALR